MAMKARLGKETLRDWRRREEWLMEKRIRGMLSGLTRRRGRAEVI